MNVSNKCFYFGHMLYVFYLFYWILLNKYLSSILYQTMSTIIIDELFLSFSLQNIKIYNLRWIRWITNAP